jgi:hypothetical protein
MTAIQRCVLDSFGELDEEARDDTIGARRRDGTARNWRARRWICVRMK